MTVVLLCVAAGIVAAWLACMVAMVRHIGEIRAVRLAMACHLEEMERTTAALRGERPLSHSASSKEEGPDARPC